jgi:hypothetical protein
MADKNRFTFLLAGLVSLLGLSAVFHHPARFFPFLLLMFIFVLAGALRLSRVSPRAQRIGIGFGIIGLFVYTSLLNGWLPRENLAIQITSPLAFTVFMGIAAFTLLSRIMTEQAVTSDTVRGGIAMYLLMGCFWTPVFRLIVILDPAAFGNAPGSEDPMTLLYFSFATLTTLGYGDIVPVNPAARIAAVLEVAFGQIFLAVFIARLVGMHIAGKQSKS